MATVTIKQVDKKLTSMKEDLTAKRDFLNKLLDELKDTTEFKDLEKDVRDKLTIDVLKGKVIAEYKLSYETFSNSLEPIYYWIHDALKGEKFGFNYDVQKVKDAFAAAEASAFYGEMGRRRTELEKRAGELMGTINMVVKSILNLIYDLKEFELRLDEYDKLNSDSEAVSTSADYALKTIWLTEVDSKKGPGSVNALVQNLNYVMLRDAFFSVHVPVGKTTEIEKDVLKKVKDEMDIPVMVKRILQGRVKEYILWRSMSERELRKRYKIERSYLKSQVSSLKMYSDWARPYLIATKKLLPPELKADEMGELPSAFNTMVTFIDIFAKKEVKKAGTTELKVKDKNKTFSVLEVKFFYRVVPGGQTQEGYRGHTGKVDIVISSHAMQQRDLDNLEKARQEEIMNFIDAGTKDTLDAIQEDIDRFLAEEDKEEPKEEKLKFRPFKKTVDSAKRHYETARGYVEKVSDVVSTISRIGEDRQEAWNVARLVKSSQEKAKKDAYKLYYLYKAIHGMLIWE